MCGVAGIFNLNGAPVDRASLQRMTRTLAHRGPDGEGIWIDGAVGFGHRRLAIRDLSERGQQPMTDPTGRVTVTYNGEIYNDAGLRRRLAREGGAEFRSTCDTEVLGPAYLQWNVDAFSRLEGMFAVGLWDASHRRLVLARDPVGIKPLFFSVVGRSLRFASEMKALLSCEDQPSELDPRGLHSFLAQGYPGPTKSLVEGVRPLPPGSVLIATADGWKITRYWRPQRTGEITQLGEALAEFDSLWETVVSDHLVSDVPVGLLLSAGVDSTLIASGLRRRRDVEAFTSSFASAEFDEAGGAAKIAEYCGLPHTAVPAEASDTAARFLSVVRHYDGQCADSSGLAFHSVCEAARRHAKVVLTGDGADEFFGGYQTYRASRFGALLGHVLPRWIAQAGADLLRSAGSRGTSRVSLSEKAFRFLSGIAAAPDCPHPQWRRYAFPHHTRVLYTPAMRMVVAEADPLEEYTRAVRSGDGTLVDRCLVADQTYYLPGDLLIKSDAMSMAHSIEVRVPFLDRRIMEFAGRLAPSLLTPLQGPDKRILRAALARRGVPASVISERKRGFNVPLARMLRENLSPLADDLLDRNADVSAPYLSSDAIRNVWRDHKSGRGNHGYVLWALLTLAAWRSGLHPTETQTRLAA